MRTRGTAKPVLAGRLVTWLTTRSYLPLALASVRSYAPHDVEMGKPTVLADIASRPPEEKTHSASEGTAVSLDGINSSLSGVLYS